MIKIKQMGDDGGNYISSFVYHFGTSPIGDYHFRIFFKDLSWSVFHPFLYELIKLLKWTLLISNF